MGNMKGGRPAAYPNEIRDYVISQVCDEAKTIAATVRDLNAGRVEAFGKVPVNYSTAQTWIERENRLRDAAIPLEHQHLDEFVGRLWTVAMGELRKVEREARTRKALDVKRLNELEAFAARCRRHLKHRDPSEPDTPETDTAASLLERLADSELSESGEPRSIVRSGVGTLAA